MNEKRTLFFEPLKAALRIKLEGPFIKKTWGRIDILGFSNVYTNIHTHIRILLHTFKKKNMYICLYTCGSFYSTLYTICPEGLIQLIRIKLGGSKLCCKEKRKMQKRKKKKKKNAS